MDDLDHQHQPSKTDCNEHNDKTLLLLPTDPDRPLYTLLDIHDVAPVFLQLLPAGIYTSLVHCACLKMPLAVDTYEFLNVILGYG